MTNGLIGTDDSLAQFTLGNFFLLRLEQEPEMKQFESVVVEAVITVSFRRGLGLSQSSSAGALT